jgi:hypothetical protein
MLPSCIAIKCSEFEGLPSLLGLTVLSADRRKSFAQTETRASLPRNWTLTRVKQDHHIFHSHNYPRLPCPARIMIESSMDPVPFPEGLSLESGNPKSRSNSCFSFQFVTIDGELHQLNNYQMKFWRGAELTRISRASIQPSTPPQAAPSNIEQYS